MQNKLRKIVHHKERQKLDDLVSSTSAGCFFVKDPKGIRKTGLLVYSATLQYIYNVEEDGLVQIPSMALAGAFGAGACGSWGRWSNAITATGGTTTSVTTTTSINNLCVGKVLRFATGANAGKDVTVTDVKIIPGGTNTIYFTGSGISAPANGDTFRVDTGLYYVLNAYAALAAGVFKSYDPLTGVVTSLQQTGLPAAWGTEGRLVGNPSYFDPFSTGTASAGSTTTTLVTGKTWTANQRSNSQVRITGGTGAGQVRIISSNTTNTLTVSAAWTVTPDATSTYAIEGNDDYMYLLGNNAVTLYRYQISTNTWSTITPTVARAAAMGSGGGANRVAKTGNAQRADETNILDGRFIYSFRGAVSTVIDRYDIALNLWTAITHIQNAETFTTGSCYDVDGARIYAKKESTGRYFYYDVTGNILMPFTRNVTAEGGAVVGDKMFTVTFIDGADSITYLYTIFNTSNLMYRMLVI